MEEQWLRRLEGWHDFYAFAGTAAATLMGLMFVVVSLSRRSMGTDQGRTAVRAFFTPIVAFFATTILVSMLMLAPGSTSKALSVLLAVVCIAGLAYMFATGAHKQWSDSELPFDDLMFYVALPFLSYLIVGAAAVSLWNSAWFGLYGVAAAMGLFLLTGIRNAWDLVVYLMQHYPND